MTNPSVVKWLTCSPRVW